MQAPAAGLVNYQHHSSSAGARSSVLQGGGRGGGVCYINAPAQTWKWRWFTEADEPALLNPRRNPGSTLKASAKSIAIAKDPAAARWLCECGYLPGRQTQRNKSEIRQHAKK